MPGDKVKASAIYAEAFRLEGEVARLKQEAQELRDAADTWLAERDALRAALQDIVTLCMDVADTPDWRKAVGDKARKALHGEAAWQTK
jgi:hypothetical protein